MASAGGKSNGGGFYDPGQNPEKIVLDTLFKAHKQKKRIIIQVGTNECPSVNKLDELFIGDKKIAARLERDFIHMRLPLHQAFESNWVRSHLPPVDSTPTLFVLEQDGSLLVSPEWTSLVTNKTYDRDKILGLLGEWSSPRGAPEAAVPAEDAVDMMPEIEGLGSPKITGAELPIVVYFRSSQATTEKELTATLEEVAADSFGKAEFFTVNADFPRLVLIKNGKRRTISIPPEGRPAKELRSLIAAWLSQ